MDIDGRFVFEMFPTKLAHYLFPHAMKTMQVVLNSGWAVEDALTDGAHVGIPAITLSHMFPIGLGTKVTSAALWALQLVLLAVSPSTWCSL